MRRLLFKVTGPDGASYHGGTGAWSLPTQNADGTWTPGVAGAAARDAERQWQTARLMQYLRGEVLV